MKNRLVHSNRIRLLVWSAALYACVAVICMIIGLRYLAHFDFPTEPIGVLYAIVTYIGHFLVIAYIPWLIVLLPLVLLAPFRKFIQSVSIIVASGLLCLVLLDSLVFASSRFHFNMLTIRILGIKTWGFGIVYCAIFYLFLNVLSPRIWRFCEKRKLWPIWLAIGACAIIFQLATHGMHMWADANAYTPITRLTPYLPFFYPSVDKHFMRRHGWAGNGVPAFPASDSSGGKSSGDFLCPLKPLEFNDSGSPKNLLLILVDDMRADLLNDSCAPLLMTHASKGIRYLEHFSGGNSTRAGLFSFFYGLPISYWQHVWSNRIPPLMMDLLQERNYRLGIFTSAALDAPAEMDATSFVRVPGLRIRTTVPNGEKGYVRDSAITGEWRHFLDTSDARRPFFGFLFYDNLCTPDIAPGYEKSGVLTDGAGSGEKKRLRQQRQMRYVDSLISLLIDDIALRGLADSTVIIITADHGEEYNDNGLGFSGHGSAYSRWQLHVPLLVFWPEKVPAVISKRTSHFDVPATIITGLSGCTNPPEDFCSGRSLFDKSEWEWLISGSYFNDAIIEPEQVTIQYPGGYFELRDDKYRVKSSAGIHPSILTAAFNEMGRFYKR